MDGLTNLYPGLSAGGYLIADDPVSIRNQREAVDHFGPSTASSIRSKRSTDSARSGADRRALGASFASSAPRGPRSRQAAGVARAPRPRPPRLSRRLLPVARLGVDRCEVRFHVWDTLGERHNMVDLIGALPSAPMASAHVAVRDEPGSTLFLPSWFAVALPSLGASDGSAPLRYPLGASQKSHFTTESSARRRRGQGVEPDCRREWDAATFHTDFACSCAAWPRN